jgi:hypothetical protein
MNSKGEFSPQSVPSTQFSFGHRTNNLSTTTKKTQHRRDDKNHFCPQPYHITQKRFEAKPNPATKLQPKKKAKRLTKLSTVCSLHSQSVVFPILLFRQRERERERER